MEKHSVKTCKYCSTSENLYVTRSGRVWGYCIKCKEEVDRNRIEKGKKTSLERFGVDNIFRDVEYIKRKTKEKLGIDNIFRDVEYIKKKRLEKLGVEYASQLLDHNAKVRKTKLERYGDENYNNIKPATPELRKIRRINALKRIEQRLLDGHQLFPNYNPKGCQVLNEIMKQCNTHIQHAENGGEYHIKELGYFVDGYDKENNIVYEYDERDHFNGDKLKDEDIRRQEEIIEYLNCEFIRLKDEK